VQIEGTCKVCNKNFGCWSIEYKCMFTYLKFIVYDKVFKPGQSLGITLKNHKMCKFRAPVRYVTTTWIFVLLNKKYIYCCLKCIVYVNLLKPRQIYN